MSRRAGCGVLLSLLALMAPLDAAAHAGGLSYLSLSRTDAGWRGQLDLPLPDAGVELGLDADGDGLLRWGEVLDATPRIDTRIASRLQLRIDTRTCDAGLLAPVELVRRDDGPHLRLALGFDCSVPAAGAATLGGTTLGAATLDATAWLAEVPDHGILVDARAGGGAATLLAGSVARLPLADPQHAATGADARATPGTAGRFVRLGIEHLLTGYDHLAFLALLLLGAVRGALAAPRAAGLAVLRVVTAFTLAHSVTLGLAASGVLRLPSAPVEAAIAASIVATALGLLLRPDWAPGWRTAFAIGLVHGLGFAGLLGELLEGRALAVPLAAFNVGLELGQLSVVLVALPLLAWLARRPAWQARLVPPLALGLAGCGFAWLMERL